LVARLPNDQPGHGRIAAKINYVCLPRFILLISRKIRVVLGDRLVQPRGIHSFSVSSAISLLYAVLSWMIAARFPLKSFWFGYFSVEYKDVSVFIIIILVLVFRQASLLGRSELEKA
jgi:hypothetical protein